jgi:hypothetical protein
VGERAAIVGGLLFVISLLEIELARQARMYAFYQVAAMVVVWLMFRLWQEGRGRQALLVVGAIMVSMGLHAMGVTLALLFLLVAVRQRRALARLAALGGVALFALLARLQAAGTGGAMRGFQSRATEAAVEEGAPRAFGSEPLAFGLDRLGALPLALTIVLLALVGAGLGLAGSRGRPVADRVLAAGWMGAVLAAAGMHQLGLAAILLVLLVLQRQELFPEGSRATRALAGGALVLVLAGGVWLALALAEGLPAREVAEGLFGRQLGRFVRHLALWPPAVTLPALAGLALVVLRAWRGKAGDGERFVSLAVLTLVAGRSLVATKWQLRYLADLWPLWELLAAWALVLAWEALGSARSLAGPLRRRAAAALAAILAAAVLLLPGTSASGTWSTLRRGPGQGPALRPGESGFETDLRGACAWVAERMGPNDRVVATDWLTTYCYLGRVDGWIRSRGWGRQSTLVEGVARDVYLGAQVLPDPESLEDFLGGDPAWIVAGGKEWADPLKLSDAMRAWLEQEEPLFVAADGSTRVYRRAGPRPPAGGEQP